MTKPGRYTPGVLGRDVVIPRPNGLKGLYLRLFGVPDVRLHLTAAYLERALGELSSTSVLDVGCGNGMLSCRMAARNLGGSVLGIDREEEGLGFARRLAEQNGLPNVGFRRCDVRSAVMDGGYNLVTCLAVLQFIGDVSGLLKRLNALLVPGGHLVLQVPAVGGSRFLMRLPQAAARLPDFKEARGAFTEDEIRSLLVDAGFVPGALLPILKGPTVLAKEVFYLALSIHPVLTYLSCPLLNWITVFDDRYPGRPSGFFVVATKAP